MSRIQQKPGARGSLKWIQRATGEEWQDLHQAILRRIPDASSIVWYSPRATDQFAEYRDAAFLELLGFGHLSAALSDFWPAGGPQWDALARTDHGDLLIVEAKAHVAELCSPPSAARPESLARITARLEQLAIKLHARDKGASWTSTFYQLANRIAHLAFLRENGVSAFLVFVNFINDHEMGGPTSQETWQAAYEVAYHVLGLPRRHSLSRFIIEVFPNVAHHG